ncbi:hypothetical protein EV401DRAFT_2062389 [Pisolithus croceorrhizus]|nr:hypothetical protein EV401DRAFT_2062389 [Pisolithus croceorrhizus]
MGMLSLSAKYLSSPNFQLDELESLHSSRFLSLDEESDFTPTLAMNQARDSMSALAGPSTSLRTSLPKSPPSSNPDSHPGTHVPTQSLSSVLGSQSPKRGHVALPISRTATATTAGAGSSSGLSFASSRQEGSGTWSKEEGTLPSLARLRRESSSTAGRSTTDLPGALPIRRSGITPMYPFKSSTLSSGSPSIHSPGHGGKSSPPFAPSSLGDRDRRRSMTSADGVDLTPGSFGRGRYRSSFGHRYSPGGSSGGGEGVNKDGSGSNRERGRTTSFLAASTDDDELSMFVQEIDARKPLTSTTGRSVAGRVEGSSRGSPSSLSRGGGDLSGVGLNPDHRRSSSSISAGPMLTREAEVDEKLKHMNEMFLASLEGLGYGSGRRRSSEQVGVGRDGHDASPGTRSLGGGGGSSGGSVSGSGVRRPRLGSMRSFSGGDVASSGGSAEVIGRLELDEDSKRRRWGE